MWYICVMFYVVTLIVLVARTFVSFLCCMYIHTYIYLFYDIMVDDFFPSLIFFDCIRSL